MTKLPGLLFALVACTSLAQGVEDYASLRAQSQGLSAAQREQARQLFDVGFQLWRDSEFPASALSFRRGLEIDPANPVANYYLGDALSRTGERNQAIRYLQRAGILGDGTPEGFKALALIEQLQRPADVNALSGDDLLASYVGEWVMEGSGHTMQIQRDAISRKLSIGGQTGAYPAQYSDLTATPDGKQIIFYVRRTFFSDTVFRGLLRTKDRLEGTYVDASGGPFPWAANRK